MISGMLKARDGRIPRILARSSAVVSVEKLAPLRREWSQREAVRHRRAARMGERLGERESMRRADCDFRYHPEASEDFLMETRSLPALTHSYPRRFTFYVAHPIRSILP